MPIERFSGYEATVVEGGEVKEAAFKWQQAPLTHWLSTPYGVVALNDLETVGMIFDEMRLDLEYGPPLGSEPDHLDHIRSLHTPLSALKRRFESQPPAPLQR